MADFDRQLLENIKKKYFKLREERRDIKKSIALFQSPIVFTDDCRNWITDISADLFNKSNKLSSDGFVGETTSSNQIAQIILNFFSILVRWTVGWLVGWILYTLSTLEYGWNWLVWEVWSLSSVVTSMLISHFVECNQRVSRSCWWCLRVVLNTMNEIHFHSHPTPYTLQRTGGIHNPCK